MSRYPLDTRPSKGHVASDAEIEAATVEHDEREARKVVLTQIYRNNPQLPMSAGSWVTSCEQLIRMGAAFLEQDGEGWKIVVNSNLDMLT